LSFSFILSIDIGVFVMLLTVFNCLWFYANYYWIFSPLL